MLKRFLQCLGFASILLVANYGDLLGGGGEVRMHVPFPIAGIVWAQVADIVLLALALFAALTAVMRLNRDARAVRLLLLIFVPIVLLGRIDLSFHLALGTAWMAGCSLLWAASVVTGARALPRVYKGAFALADALGVFLGVFALASLAQLLFLLRWKPGPTQHGDMHAATSSATPPQHPLIVWIVLDELSYNQLFGHRAAGLKLPHFDALRQESTLYTDVQPAGKRTAKIIPSLLGGQMVTDIRYSQGNRLFVRYEGQKGWHPFTSRDTLFYQAREDGWRTAAVGWYNPYCTLYGDAIGNCYWTNLDTLGGPMIADAGFWHNVKAPLGNLLEQALHPIRAGQDACSVEVPQRRRTFTDLRAHALALLQRGQDDFVFLHMPVPHSPNIWNRQTGSFTEGCGRSYLDSLALADTLLGQFLQVLQASPRWPETTVIVQGDHSWRTFIWDRLPSWTAEDRAASADVFDPRPALLIHAAGQTQPQTDASAWPLLNLHTTLSRMLSAPQHSSY